MEIIQPKKSLGQNFLVDRNIAQKIVNAIDLAEGDTIIEIGAGTGSLTSLLLNTEAHIISVEIDNRACEVLKTTFPIDKYPNFTLINENFLKLSISKFSQENKKLKVIGNIPYNLSSEIFFKLFESHNVISSAVLMIQKELAQRLVSPPGNKQYGILSIALKLVGEGKMLFDVNPGCFIPQPKVTSTVIKFTFKNDNQNHDYFDIMKLVRLAFNQRRKMLRKSLEMYVKSHFENSDQPAIPDSVKKYFNLRAEQLSVDDFKTIFYSLKAMGNRKGE